MLRKALYYFRFTLATAVLCGCSLYGVVASIVLTLVGKQHLAQWATARCFYYASILFLGIDVKVENEHYLENKPYIIVSNHQSTLDILMLGRVFPQGCTVTSKKSLKYTPFLGWFMTLSGTLFLERANRQKSVETLNRSLDVLKKEKRALWIFPEGTRSYTTNLNILPFKKGAFHLARQGKLPIVPVVVSNTSTLMNHKWKVFNKGCIVARVMKPISVDDLTTEDVGKFSEDLREKMLTELQDLAYSQATVDTHIPPEAKAYKRVENATALSSENSSERVSTLTKEIDN
ncbi:hypothetical protein ZYGR_0H01430 [Zygosaccharomyces rouxii]|uniref:1-acyl-sn-glycerol-3-phosphate acyltransferase n=2 Tax=Zygosaccharomyces rouxii TaxID=4956 RepID=C5DRC3_ZYGRC|nr:uncharacterized protein ZYRO0B07326g [Zygosaccharomyces rouxii]KAH9200124.1 hypothetical protein LQ764DRAFT_112765 [Zygosaccharomyces rouxii]GAV47302.1 hypothetical protein ZYGR_0H01430 [Zygosaccharomyces rouxii]CAR26334.1 ZYRO0B07326p [Zygosaccharomyces rouxii]